MTPFDQTNAECRCEWGLGGVRHLAPADVVVVVDVLSFTTCVDVALAQGATILPFPSKGSDAEAFARAQSAELAGARGVGRYSLSPLSFLNATPGLRCVLPSPNGATLVLEAAATGAVVLAGCLRNAVAVARAAQRIGRTVNVVPAGEQWPDGSLRPGIEDWLGAGAILRELSGTKSSEALSAIAAFERAEHTLGELVAGSASGRELIERGYPQDVTLAAALNVSREAPRLATGAFVGATSTPGAA